MSSEINQGETKTTNQGETDLYVDTFENAGTYENAGTVQLEDGQTFATSSSIQSSGWSVSITHPTSGRVIRPSVINPSEVQYIPGPNTMPQVRLPVRVNVGWLDTEFNNNPAMSVHLDGEELPVDELVDVEHAEAQTILIGEGGSELRQRVSVEYDAEDRPVAATTLIDNNTTYTSVDNTPAPESTSEVVQNPTTTTDFDNLFNQSNIPAVFTGGGMKPAQTCFTVEAEDYDRRNNSTTIGRTGFSGGDPGAGQELNDVGDWVEYDFTLDYDMPASSIKAGHRYYATSDNPEITFSIDGTTVYTYASGIGPDAIAHNGGNGSYPSDLSSGSHTLRVECTGSNTGTYELDVVSTPHDDRYSYTFDNTTDSNDALSGPELYPDSEEYEFDRHTTAFSVVGGSLTSTITDTGDPQALALSNDGGQTYPISASNTTSVSGSFSSDGASLRLKATLGRYSPNGTRSQTPTEGYDSQLIDDYELTADIEFENLLIDDGFDDTLASILTEILEPRYAWKYSIESGTGTVTVDEPGNTVASDDPELSESRIRKQIQTHATVTIKGSNLPVSGEEFQASTSFVNLAENNIVTGSEAVTTTSGGTQFTRGTDYEMDYSGGQIKILSSGSMSSGTTYAVDYQHQVEASHTAPEGSSDELIRTIPGVVSDRQAEQIAYVLAEVYPGVSTPRYEGRIVVPRLDVNFDPLEGLELDDLDLPDAATPLSIRGEPELTPLGLTLNLGSAPRLEESLRAISSQVSSLSDRV